MRLVAYGNHRSRCLRSGSNAGSRSGSSASRCRSTYRRSQQHGRFSSRAGYCRCGSRSCDHDGSARRASRRDWTEGGRCAGWNFSRHPAVLRPGGATGSQHDEGRRRRARFSLCHAGAHGFFPERNGTDYGGGSSTTGGPGSRASVLHRIGARLPRWRRAGCGVGSGSFITQAANSMDEKRPFIIVKKAAAHGGHDGGAWKVAYADFVTAMMALFIVLWLMNSSKQVQEAVGGYFKDPTGTSKKVGSNMEGSGENFTLPRDNMPKLKEQLQTAMRQMSDFEKLKSHIEMTVTSEGLRIELSESASGTFFDTGSAKLKLDGAELLSTLAKELGSLPNKLSIEGHTDSQPYAPSAAYGNWELSADRANAARRVMQARGIRGDQIIQVRGFADQRLRKEKAPLDPANRRISLIVQYIVKSLDGDQPETKTGSE